MKAIKGLAQRLWANDTVQRTVHTFWQAASATAIAEFGGSGLDVKALTHIAADEKIAIAAIVAGGSAVLAMIRGTAKTAIANRAATGSLGDIPDTPDPLADTPDPNTPGSSTPAAATSPAPAASPATS